MNSKLYRLPAIAVIGVLFFSGCTTFETPRISLVNIGIRNARLFETIFDVELRIINNNDIPLTIKGLDCHLEVNGKNIAQGVSDSKTEIPAYGTSTIPMTLYSSLTDMLRSALNTDKENAFKYKVSGRLRLDNPQAFFPSVISFSSDGKTSLD